MIRWVLNQKIWKFDSIQQMSTTTFHTRKTPPDSRLMRPTRKFGIHFVQSSSTAAQRSRRITHNMFAVLHISIRNAYEIYDYRWEKLTASHKLNSFRDKKKTRENEEWRVNFELGISFELFSYNAAHDMVELLKSLWTERANCKQQNKYCNNKNCV